MREDKQFRGGALKAPPRDLIGLTEILSIQLAITLVVGVIFDAYFQKPS